MLVQNRPMNSTEFNQILNQIGFIATKGNTYKFPGLQIEISVSKGKYHIFHTNDESICEVTYRDTYGIVKQTIGEKHLCRDLRLIIDHALPED